MKQVVIYSSSSCPYCIMAKELLESKGIDYKELRIDISPDLVAEVVKKSGGQRTVPQIFIGDYHVGGYDDLSALDNKGELDVLLSG
jgi:glutaredoxin 3